MRSLLAQRPNLPPQQSSKHQVQISGEIRLARAGGRRVRAHHEEATLRERSQSHAYQFPEPSLHPVAHYRRANRAANSKAYP
jgi:hypothetical protein